jgi:hypothetical protein
MTHFANHSEIDRFVEITDDGSTPNLHKLALTVRNLRDWADENSDGWAHWAKPSRAASNAVAILDAVETAWGTGGFITDVPNRELAAARTPIKRFLTRQGVDHAGIIVDTLPGAAIAAVINAGPSDDAYEPHEDYVATTRYVVTLDNEAGADAELRELLPEGSLYPWTAMLFAVDGDGYRTGDAIGEAGVGATPAEALTELARLGTWTTT